MNETNEKPRRPQVGFRNPPEHSRFKKGQSGNPHGRPKGTLNFAKVVERTLREKVVIVENGKRKTVTKLEAAIKQVVDQAASGQLKAFPLLAMLMRCTEERGIQAAAPSSKEGGTNINLITMNIDEAIGRRLAETYLGRHGTRHESGNSE